MRSKPGALVDVGWRWVAGRWSWVRACPTCARQTTEPACPFCAPTALETEVDGFGGFRIKDRA